MKLIPALLLFALTFLNGFSQNLFVKYFNIGYNIDYETETLKALEN